LPDITKLWEFPGFVVLRKIFKTKMAEFKEFCLLTGHGTVMQDMTTHWDATSHKSYLTYVALCFCLQFYVLLRSSVVDMNYFFYLQIKRLNEYHCRCREIVGPLLKKMGHIEAVEWLYRETEAFG
jgi:hypothetical protein